MIHTAVTDSQWFRVLPVIHPPADHPGRPAKHRGRPPTPERQILNGILHFLTTGCSWLDLPYPEYPSYSVCYRIHQSWLRDGTWPAIIDALVQELHNRTGVDLWAEWSRFISTCRTADAVVPFEIPSVVFNSDSDCVVVLVFLLNLLEILADDHRYQLLIKNRFPASLSSAGNVQFNFQP
jgi:transposase